MKAILNHIATKKVAKHVNRSTANKLAEFLLSEGYVKTGRLMTKDKHQFVFNGHDNKWVVFYRKVDVAPLKPQVMPKDRELELEEVAS